MLQRSKQLFVGRGVTQFFTETHSTTNIFHAINNNDDVLSSMRILSHTRTGHPVTRIGLSREKRTPFI